MVIAKQSGGPALAMKLCIFRKTSPARWGERFGFGTFGVALWEFMANIGVHGEELGNFNKAVAK